VPDQDPDRHSPLATRLDATAPTGASASLALTGPGTSLIVAPLPSDTSGPSGGSSGPAAGAEPPTHRDIENALRPRTFAEYIGQRHVIDNLRVFVEAARRRGQPLDHLLFYGPPGLGKTTIAMVIAHTMGTNIKVTTAPTIADGATLVAILTALKTGDVFFIDEIHRLDRKVEEMLYPAMEDFRVDIPVEDGMQLPGTDKDAPPPTGGIVSLKLERFTLLGATTRTGLLTGPLRGRFRYTGRLDYYSVDELTTIVTRSAKILETTIDGGGAREIARRSRGTPRTANHLLSCVRDFAQVDGNGHIDRGIADYALKHLGIDSDGLNDVDLRYLKAITTNFGGGPVGIDTLCAALSEDRGTLEDVTEPYLIQQGMLQRTPRGRVVTRAGRDHIRPPGPKLALVPTRARRPNR
jgi:holliday junction DNA helicase RuvB